MQAVNGSRSAELSGSDVLLDSGGSDGEHEQQVTSAPDDAMPHASHHATVPATAPAQPVLPQDGEQAAEQQQGGVGSEGVHHESVPSWQQSEGSMQEVASTSASSESGVLMSLLLPNTNCKIRHVAGYFHAVLLLG